jgi:hypothetical protein
MLKSLLPVFIITVAVCCLSKTNDDRPAVAERRKIKMIMESVHDPIFKPGKFESSLKPSKDSLFYESYFNRQGKLIKRNTFNAKAILQTKMVFNYDKLGNNTECLVYHSDGSLASKKVCTFNSKNQLTEAHESDANGKVINKMITTNDSAGYRSLTSYQRINGRLVKTLESVLDTNDNNVANNYFSDGLVELREIRQYDAKGNVVETFRLYPLLNEETIVRCDYDEHNNKTGEIILKNNLVTTKTIYRYDSKHNLTDAYRYGVLGTLEGHHRYVFEFDSEGNWTKRIDLFNGRPVSVSVRRLEYY